MYNEMKVVENAPMRWKQLENAPMKLIILKPVKKAPIESTFI